MRCRRLCCPKSLPGGHDDHGSPGSGETTNLTTSLTATAILTRRRGDDVTAKEGWEELLRTVVLSKERKPLWRRGKSSGWCKSAVLDSSQRMMAGRSSSTAPELRAPPSSPCGRGNASPLTSKRVRRGRVP